ncbi:hypothetical protein [Streptomyces sp. LS1784]|uniref:hypothetical protein n=1 Tax=Streptomyces sp. LS1784 TaxID=2851533 RepID=UPI001CC97A49|nr:hypothetical protein [Streptomyces sp. LS1784]
MPKRKAADNATFLAGFLRRTDLEWRELGVSDRWIENYRYLPCVGWVHLAQEGALRPAEIDYLHRIAAGTADLPPGMQARETASLVLANIPPAD